MILAGTGGNFEIERTQKSILNTYELMTRLEQRSKNFREEDVIITLFPSGPDRVQAKQISSFWSGWKNQKHGKNPRRINARDPATEKRLFAVPLQHPPTKS